MAKAYLARLAALCAGWFCVAGSSAAPVVSGGQINGGAAGECPLLAEPVTVFLSKGVKGAYVCNGSTKVIGLAGCHQQGQRRRELSDGVVTTSGAVFRVRSVGKGMEVVAGCPLGDEPIPDEQVSTDLPD